MPTLVVGGATLRCTQGSSTATLVLARTPMTADDAIIATVDDYKPIVNIPSLGTCGSMTNPQVASATALAQGVLQRMPCVPVTSGRWSPGSSVSEIDGVPALMSSSTCRCSYNGTISVSNANNRIETD